MSKQKNPINGWINLHKPLGMSSAQAVGKVKWLLKPSKIGHAGTLDPLATGILPLALGEATKCANLLMDAKKTYEFDVTFGERRTTDDAEGEVVATSDSMPTRAEIQALLPRFTGQITQLPPAYSALKVDGRRAYALARAGEEVVMKSRQVTVYSLELVSCVIPGLPRDLAVPPTQANNEMMGGIPRQARDDKVTMRFRATVSKGTYIRSLGRDIAQAAGSEGYISRLHRARVGPFSDANAISLDFLEKSAHMAATSGPNPEWLLPLSVALDDIPALSLSAQQAQILRHGQHPPIASPDLPLAAAMLGEQLIGLVRVEAGKIISQRLLNVDA